VPIPSRSCSHGEHRHSPSKSFRKRTAVQRAKDRVEARDTWRLRVSRLADRVAVDEVGDRLSEGPSERGHRTMAQPEAKGLRKVADQLNGCGRRVEGVYGCQSHGPWYQTRTCSHPLCPWCSSSRRGRLLSKYESHVTRYATAEGDPRALMLTLIQPTTEAESFRSGVSRLRKRHGKLTRAMRKEVPGVGGLTSYEATPRPGRTWHVHAHVLLHLPEVLPPQWTHPDARPGWSPLNPWRVRWLWAVAELDLRYPENKAKAETLEALADAAAVHWQNKVEHRARSVMWTTHAEQEAEFLLSWADACRGFGLPAVLDVRPKHPSEAVKYITKGPVKVARSGVDPLTDWHVLDLVRSVKGMRRTDAWGSLYRLTVDDDEESGEVEGRDLAGTVPCPGCSEPCDPMFPEDLVEGLRPVADWLLRARCKDGRPVRPAGPF